MTPAFFSRSTTLQNLAEALERHVFALQRDEQMVGGGEGVHREHAERGRAVDDDGAVAAGVAQRLEHGAQPEEVVFLLRQLDLDGGEVHLATG